MHVSSNRWNSAITEYAISTAKAVILKGHKSVFCSLEDSVAEERIKKEGFETFSLPSFSLAHIGKLRAIVEGMNPDTIFVYGGPETMLTKGLGRQVIRFRGQAIPADEMLFGLKQRWSLSHVNVTITPSDAITRALRDLTNGNLAVETVLLGCDEQKFKPIDIKDDRVTFTIVGRFDPVKGHERAMQVFRRVKDRWTEKKKLALKIIGLPANLSEPHLKTFAEKAGLAWGDDVIPMVRKVDDIAAEMSKSAIGWVPSVGSEIICRVAEEFLLCGTPVVVSDVGSLSEVIKEPQFGISAASDDEMVTAILRLASERVGELFSVQERRAMAARRFFSYSAMSERLCDVLDL